MVFPGCSGVGCRREGGQICGMSERKLASEQVSEVGMQGRSGTRGMKTTVRGRCRLHKTKNTFSSKDSQP